MVLVSDSVAANETKNTYRSYCKVPRLKWTRGRSKTSTRKAGAGGPAAPVGGQRVPATVSVPGHNSRSPESCSTRQRSTCEALALHPLRRYTVLHTSRACRFCARNTSTNHPLSTPETRRRSHHAPHSTNHTARSPMSSCYTPLDRSMRRTDPYASALYLCCRTAPSLTA